MIEDLTDAGFFGDGIRGSRNKGFMKASLLVLLLSACSPPSSLSLSGTEEAITTYYTSSSGGGTSGSGNRTASIAAATGDLLVAFASVSGNTQTSPTMTDNKGGTYALVGQALWDGSANNMLCFVRNSLTTSAGNTTLTLDTNTNTAGELVIVAYSGMTRTGASAVKQITATANQATSTTPSVAYANPVTSGDQLLAAVASSDKYTDEPADWNERENVYQSTPTTALEVTSGASGFTGTTVTYGSPETSGYAAMAVELDASVSGPPVDAGVAVDAPHIVDAPRMIDAVIDGSIIDADLVDARVADASVADASIAADAGAGDFSYGVVYQMYGRGQNPAQITESTDATGSTFLIMMGGYTRDIVKGPTDNKGNAYAEVGAEETWTNWPDDGTTIWSSANATGGPSTTWSQYVTQFNEITMFEIEVPNAGASPQITSTFNQQGNSGVYTPAKGCCNTLTSNSVTTTGPATLIALWWGAGPTGYGTHIATPNNGFTNLADCDIDNPNGYVQGYMAYKTVDAAGTYNVTWTYQPKQGAELWLIAVQP